MSDCKDRKIAVSLLEKVTYESETWRSGDKEGKAIKITEFLLEKLKYKGLLCEGDCTGKGRKCQPSRLTLLPNKKETPENKKNPYGIGELQYRAVVTKKYDLRDGYRLIVTRPGIFEFEIGCDCISAE